MFNHDISWPYPSEFVIVAPLPPYSRIMKNTLHFFALNVFLASTALAVDSSRGPAQGGRPMVEGFAVCAQADRGDCQNDHAISNEDDDYHRYAGTAPMLVAPTNKAVDEPEAESKMLVQPPLVSRITGNTQEAQSQMGFAR